MSERIQSVWLSPLGELRIAIEVSESDVPRCIGLYFAEHHPAPRQWCENSQTVDWQAHPAMRNVVDQLQSYFHDGRISWKVQYRFGGTTFQNEVWSQLTQIPPGQTRSYQEIAVAMDRPRAVRAVGAAIARNPISIIVPCHRVIASGGQLTGFAGGLDRKRFLLEHESGA